MKKKFITFLASVIAAVVGVCGLAGCNLIPRTFTSNDMQITLDYTFKETSPVPPGQTVVYESLTVGVAALSEPFSMLSGLLTLNDYTNKVLIKNGYNTEKFEREGKEYMYFTYEQEVEGTGFFYLATTHKASKSFWLIQFFCFSSQKDKYTEKFLAWADTITFTADAPAE